MKQLMIYILAVIISTNTIAAQDGAFTDQSDNDPKAKAILDKLKTKYDKYLSMEVTVSLTIEVPEQDAEVIEGKMVQSGEKYRVEMGDNVIISDAETVWTVMKQNEIVQVSDAEGMDKDEESVMMSPKDLMKIYENGDYIYAMTNEERENDRVIQQIEFKPLDDESEYFKMRLTVDKENETISRIKIFSRDGSRYTLDIKKLKANKIYDSEFFKYDKSICPECEIEDIRF